MALEFAGLVVAVEVQKFAGLVEAFEFPVELELAVVLPKGFELALVEVKFADLV